MSCVFSKISTGKKYNREPCWSAVGGFSSGCTTSICLGPHLFECHSFNSCLTQGLYIFKDDTHLFKQRSGQRISGWMVLPCFLSSRPKKWKGLVSALMLRCHPLVLVYGFWVGQWSSLGVSGGNGRSCLPGAVPVGSQEPPLQRLHSFSKPKLERSCCCLGWNSHPWLPALCNGGVK